MRVQRHRRVKLKIHRWEKGLLREIEEFYDSVEEAKEAHVKMDYSVIKIYDNDGEMVFTHQKQHVGIEHIY